MRHPVIALALLVLGAAALEAQLTDEELRETMDAAERTPSAETHLEAAEAARLLRDYDGARGHLEAAWQEAGPIFNGLIANALWLELASGGGQVGAQRAFRELSRVFRFRPTQISFWAGTFPEILASGAYDEVILRLDPEAEDPEYRCACYNTVAWAHRLAGRHDQAAEVWGRLVEEEPAGLASRNLDAQAQVRGQYARNLARAGRHDEARRQLRLSMETEVSEAALPAVRRRWAQTYAELGEADAAVEHLEALLEANSLISVHSLEARAAWEGIRGHPAFQAMLNRHR